MSDASRVPSGFGGAAGGGAGGRAGDNQTAVHRAHVLLRTGKHAEAINFLFSHLAGDPDDAAALDMLPGALFATGRHDEAILLAASSADAHPANADMALTHAYIASAMLRWDEAIAAATNAIELRPSTYDGYRRLAIALSKLDRLPEADAALRRAVELGNAQGVAETDMLMLQSSVLSDWPGRKEEGIAAARRAVTLDPTNDRFRSQLASLQMGMMDYWGAVRTSLGVLATSPTRDVARGTLLVALVNTQFRTIWVQFAIVILTATIGIGGFGELLGVVEDQRLAGHVVGLFGTVLNGLMVWRIYRKVGGERVVYRNIVRTVRPFTGAHYALWLQGLAVLLPLISALTGLVILITIPFFVLIVAWFLFRLSDRTMLRTGINLYGPETAAAIGPV